MNTIAGHAPAGSHSTPQPAVGKTLQPWQIWERGASVGRPRVWDIADTKMAATRVLRVSLVTYSSSINEKRRAMWNIELQEPIALPTAPSR